MIDFKAALQKVVHTAQVEAHRTARRAIFTFAEEVVDNSPIRQPQRWHKAYPNAPAGGFKANWQIGINREPTDSLNSTDADGSSTKSRLFDEIFSDGINVKNKTFYLVNNAKSIKAKGNKQSEEYVLSQLPSYAQAIEYGVGYGRTNYPYQLADKHLGINPGAVLGRATLNWEFHVQAAVNKDDMIVPF